MTRRGEAAINRAAGVGASELADLAGVGYHTPVGVWMAKMDMTPPDPQTGPMRLGLRLERALLAELAEEVGVRFTHNRMTFKHPEWPDVPMYATPDGFGPHRWTGAEIKLVGPGRWEDWREGPPESVRLQAQGQLACLPRTHRIHVGALIGSEVRTFTIDRDAAAIEAIQAGVVEFWTRYVIPEVAPAPAGPDDVWALLRARIDPEARDTRVATDEEEILGRQLAAFMDSRDDLANVTEEARRELAAAAAESNVTGHGWRATWSIRRTTDYAALIADEGIPEAVLDSYTRASPVFTFRRTKTEEAP